MDGWMYELIYGRMDGRVDGWMGAWMGGQMGGWMDFTLKTHSIDNEFQANFRKFHVGSNQELVKSIITNYYISQTAEVQTFNLHLTLQSLNCIYITTTSYKTMYQIFLSCVQIEAYRGVSVFLLWEETREKNKQMHLKSNTKESH